MEATTATLRKNPYVGPRPFQKGEELYGRERETSEIADMLMAERIILLYSPSGAGKSSLLNAAVLPRMERNGFRNLPVMRVNLEPPKGAEKVGGFNRYIHSLEHSLETTFAEKSHADHKTLLSLRFSNYFRTFRERCQELLPNFDPAQPMVLVFDQLEEIFTIDPTDQKTKMDFFVQISEVLRDRNIWAIFSIREDYVASLDPYLRPIPTQLATRYRLNMLDTTAAVEAIQRPAQAAGITFELAAAEALVKDLSMVLVQQPDGSTKDVEGNFVQAVQLQVVCRRLWAKIPENHAQITNEIVNDESNNVSNALGDYYSVQVAVVASDREINVSERAIREWFDRKLITLNNMRGQVLMAPNASEGLDNRAIWRLEQAYLVRAEKRGGATWFELSHDRLMRPIRENNGHWFESNLSPLQRQADVWNSSGRIEGMLLIGDAFSDAETWAKENENILIPVEKEFLEACRKLDARIRSERRNNRIIRQLFVIAVLAFVIAGVLAARAYVAEKNAVARELAADAVNKLTVDPELSVMLSLTSLQSALMPLDESIQSLHLSLPYLRVDHILQGHTQKIYDVAYSPDGTTLASAGDDGQVLIWSADGKLLTTLVLYAEDNDETGITNVVFNPARPVLYASDKSGKLWVIDTQTWEFESLPVTTEIIWGLDASRDGTLVAMGAEDHTTRILNTVTGKVTTLGIEYCAEQGLDACRGGHTNVVNAVAFNPDGTLLATVGEDRTIRLWEPASGRFISKFSAEKGHEYPINGVAFAHNSPLLASASVDRTIKIWNVETGKVQMTIQSVDGSAGHVDWVYDVEFTNDDASLISSSSDRTVRVWDSTYGRLQATLNGHTSQVFALSISPDGQHVATASEDTTVRIWNFDRGGNAELATMDNFDRIYDVDFSPDGSVIASAGRGLAVRLWDPLTGQKIGELLGGHTRPIESLDWTPDGKTLASAGRDGRIILWDWRAEKPEPKPLFEDRSLEWRAMSYSPDGSHLAVAGKGSTVYVLDSTSGEVLDTFDAGEAKETIKVKLPRNVLIYTLAYDREGKYLAVGYASPPLVVVWDLQTGKLAYEFWGHKDYVQGVAFSPANNNMLASVSDDGQLIVHDLANPANIRKDDTSHIGTIYDVDFSADGRRIVTAGGDGVVKVWDSGTLEVLVNLYGHSNRVLTAEFNHANSNYIVSGSEDFTVRTYTLDYKELMALAEKRLTGTIPPETCRALNILPKYCIQP